MWNPFYRVEAAGGVQYINLLQVTRVMIAQAGTDHITICLSDGDKISVSVYTWQAMKARIEELGKASAD